MREVESESGSSATAGLWQADERAGNENFVWGLGETFLLSAGLVNDRGKIGVCTGFIMRLG